MKRLAWLTDIHLEFVGIDNITDFLDNVANVDPDMILLGGDTGVASNIALFLRELEKQLQRPIYFVLGNHDFYRGSITQIHAISKKLSNTSQWLRWLTMQEIVPITDTTCLIGHDSWADGRLGNGSASRVELNDYYLIEELTGLSRQERFQKLAMLGDQAAEHFQKVLPQACGSFKNILLLTHVPPFREACWHEGQISDDEFLPHFSCKAVGDVLLETMMRYPKSNLTVLSGHTHGQGQARILPNLLVKTGSAEYGSPQLQEIITIE